MSGLDYKHAREAWVRVEGTSFTVYLVSRHGNRPAVTYRLAPSETLQSKTQQQCETIIFLPLDPRTALKSRFHFSKIHFFGPSKWTTLYFLASRLENIPTLTGRCGQAGRMFKTKPKLSYSWVSLSQRVVNSFWKILLLHVQARQPFQVRITWSAIRTKERKNTTVYQFEHAHLVTVKHI